MSLNIGDKAPNFEIEINGKKISPSNSDNKKIILYFYPKDNTPGCTAEACDFRDNIEKFEKNNVIIIGVSKDSKKSHDKFIDKHELNFPLISDPETKLCQDYGVWVEKSLYGKKYMGIERTTFLISEDGKIENIWKKVKVKNHIKEIQDFLKIK
jgi:peroxiredoxin